MTQAGPPTVADTIAHRVRTFRLRRDWSVRQLAEECAKRGAPQLTAASLANIERGQDPNAKRKRRDVTVEELLILAVVLEVPPIDLILPTGDADLVQVVPGLAAHPYDAAMWVGGMDAGRVEPGKRTWQPLPGIDHLGRGLDTLRPQVLPAPLPWAARARLIYSEIARHLAMMRRNDPYVPPLAEGLAPLETTIDPKTGAEKTALPSHVDWYLDELLRFAEVLVRAEESNLLIPPLPGRILADLRYLESVGIPWKDLGRERPVELEDPLRIHLPAGLREAADDTGRRTPQ